MARLEPEQDQLLATIVEMVRSVPRAERGSFLLLEMNGGDFLLMSGAATQPMVLASDVRMLARYGLLDSAPGGSKYSTPYDVTPEGFEYYERMKAAVAGPTEGIEDAVTRYLETPDFALRHRDSFAKWTQAADELWGTDSERDLTSVGHHVREAMQMFVSESVELYKVTGADADPTKTLNRMQAVIDQAKASPEVGEAEAAFLDAMSQYWRALNGIAQRQEHGGSKSDPLDWEDARRLVFAAAFVMFELDRVTGRALRK